MHVSELLHFYGFIVECLRLFSGELITRSIHEVALLLTGSSSRVRLLDGSFSSFSGDRVHRVSCNLGLMASQTTWNLLIRLRGISLLNLAPWTYAFLASKIESSYGCIVITSLAHSHTLLPYSLPTAGVGSLIRLLAIIENHRGSLRRNTVKFLLLSDEVHLRLGLDLIPSACKHLLLLCSQLSRLHLLDIWLLAELELRVLAHLHKLKSLVYLTIATNVPIWPKNVCLHDRLSILLHHSIGLRRAPILIFALAPGLLVVDPCRFDLVLLRLLRWTCPVI